jgi:hypothetical protein
MITLFGATSVTLMVFAYALERRHAGFALAFAGGCVLSSVYGFLVGSPPFGVIEAIWAVLAVRRYSLREGAARGSTVVESN